MSELRELQTEYIRLMETHPVSVWPRDLFAIINAAVRLHFDAPSPHRAPGAPRLTIIR